jgi:protein-tyrosine phosphatase
VFQHKINALGLSRAVTVDSAGTHDYHPGSAPDKRAQAHAAKRGYYLSGQRARKIGAKDFGKFDLILVMDYDNLEWVQKRCPPESQHKVRLLTEFSVALQSDVVPDPYYGGPNGFDHVLDLVEDACEGLMRHVKEQI